MAKLKAKAAARAAAITIAAVAAKTGGKGPLRIGQITYRVSSSHDNGRNRHFTPQINSPQGWSAGANNGGQWINMTFRKQFVRNVLTQGRINGAHGQYVKDFDLYYKNSSNSWVKIGRKRAGTNNGIVKAPVNKLTHEIQLNIKSWSRHITMRAGVEFGKARSSGKGPLKIGQITYKVSSSHDNGRNRHFTPQINSPQGWSAGANNGGQWINMTFRKQFVRNVLTQGRINGAHGQYVKDFDLYYKNSSNSWVKIGRKRAGTNNGIVKAPVNKLTHEIQLNIKSWSRHITMRAGVEFGKDRSSKEEGQKLSDSSILSGLTILISGSLKLIQARPKHKATAKKIYARVYAVAKKTIQRRKSLSNEVNAKVNKFKSDALKIINPQNLSKQQQKGANLSNLPNIPTDISEIQLSETNRSVGQTTDLKTPDMNMNPDLKDDTKFELFANAKERNNNSNMLLVILVTLFLIGICNLK